MEDEYLVAAGGRFAAVFDGHGGGGVSNYLKQNYITTLTIVSVFVKNLGWQLFSIFTTFGLF